jgi:hypothetical protein
MRNILFFDPSFMETIKDKYFKIMAYYLHVLKVYINAYIDRKICLTSLFIQVPQPT